MHQVMLQPSPASLKKKEVAEIAEPESEKDDKADLEKPDVEPRDGFGAYQFYLLNNIRIPTEARNNRINGEVELSFLVNENGRLSDFKIERSLCQSCDKEAIRLIKEGPPWILYNSDAPMRTRVTIVF
jgi:TonB family protein